MKGQQLFHSFLPGVTVAVLTTQPVWADTVKVSGVQWVESPSTLTSTYSQISIAGINNTDKQQPTTEGETFPALKPSDEAIIGSVKPSSSNNTQLTVTGKTGVPIAQLTRADAGTVPSQQQDQDRPASKKKKQSNLTPFEQKLQNILQVSGVQEETLPTPSQKRVTNQKTNSHPQLPKVAQTPARDTRASGAGKVDNAACPTLRSSPAPRAGKRPSPTPSVCIKHNSTANQLAQTPAPTPTTPESPLPSGTPTQTTPESPSPSGTPTQTAPVVNPTPVNPAVQIPDYLNSNPNPLQFPTKREEVTIEGTQPITLAQALEIARRNNRDLQVALLTLDRSQAVVREAQAALLPTIGLRANINRQQSASGQLSAEQSARQGPSALEQALGITQTTTRESSPTTAFSGSAELNYDIFTSGNRLATIGVAEQQRRQAELDVERQSEEIRQNISRQYYELQRADEQVRIQQSAVANAQASLRDAQALERAGVGTRFDVLTSQVNLANSQQQLTNALSEQVIARRQLANLLSLPQSVNISAGDSVKIAGLWNPTLEDSIVQAFQNRAELQRLLAQRKLNEQQRRQALSTLGPQVRLVASYDLLDQFDDSISIADGFSVGVQATLNLFDGGAAKARAAQQKANIAIAEAQFAQQRDQIRFQVEQAYNNQQSNLQNVQTASVALDQAREALRLARLRFQSGVGTQTDVIRAENDLTQAEGNRISAILNYNQALADLQRAVSLNQPR